MMYTFKVNAYSYDFTSYHQITYRLTASIHESG